MNGDGEGCARAPLPVHILSRRGIQRRKAGTLRPQRRRRDETARMGGEPVEPCQPPGMLVTLRRSGPGVRIGSPMLCSSSRHPEMAAAFLRRRGRARSRLAVALSVQDSLPDRRRNHFRARQRRAQSRHCGASRGKRPLFPDLDDCRKASPTRSSRLGRFGATSRSFLVAGMVRLAVRPFEPSRRAAPARV